jgi:HAD superfamily hydrolase (TIGR01484 family)
MIDKLLICTDLDRTLIPNGKAPESPDASQLFCQLVSNPQITLSYVTGRDLTLVQEAIAEYQLPLPDFVIADVGSTIYELKNNHQWLPLEDWHSKISLDWHNKTQPDLLPLFSDLKQCRLQEIEKQGLHKLSYYISLDTDINTLMAEMRSRLENQQIKSNLIWSVDEQAKVGLLDILPLSANKRHAIEYLMENQNFTVQNTVFSGDSGNDLAVLLSPIKAILVANAPGEVKEKVKSEIGKTGFTGSLYIAQGKYLNMNGNYSAGIIEGLLHYFPEINNCLKGLEK